MMRDKTEILLEQLEEDFRKHTEEETILITQLKADIEEIKKNTTDLIEFWSNAKGAINTIRVLGALIKWAAALITAALAIWYFATGKLPSPPK